MGAGYRESKMNIWKYFNLAFAIASAVQAAEAQYQATGQVAIPSIKTYLGADHVEIDLALKKI